MIEKLIIVAGFDAKLIEDFARNLECDLNISVKCFPENSRHPNELRKNIQYWLKEYKNLVICTHSDFLFIHLRALICLNVINYKNVEIYWIPNNHEQIKIEIDKDARIKNRPDGFFNSLENEYCILLQGNQK